VSEELKKQLINFFAFSSQDKWTRRQICQRIEKEWMKLQERELANKLANLSNGQFVERSK